jgi:hypothetical protein
VHGSKHLSIEDDPPLVSVEGAAARGPVLPYTFLSDATKHIKMTKSGSSYHVRY